MMMVDHLERYVKAPFQSREEVCVVDLALR